MRKRMTSRLSFLVSWPVVALVAAAAACGGSATPGGASGSNGGKPNPGGGAPLTGATSFTSAPPYGSGGSGLALGGGAATGAVAANSAAPATSTSNSSGTSTRTVQETDLYAVSGNTLFYLNSYRGLMAFDITNVDQPKFLNRWPIFGTPVQMYAQPGTGTVVVVVADWYGVSDGKSAPFHGSIVVGLDASDPSNITYLGDAQLGGDIQDTRVVGNVLYAVSEDYGWTYGWWGGPGGGVGVGVGLTVALPGAYAYGLGSNFNVIVSSVSFANNQIQQVSSLTFPGYGGVFNVTPNSIMLAHPATAPALPDGGPSTAAPPSQTILQYLDISDPGGKIVQRGSLTVDGTIQASGADNGRWNLDFADGLTAHVLGCTDIYCGSGYVLATADFSNPDTPVLDSTLPINSPGWTPAALFDTGRMYLSPQGGFSGSNVSTPLEIFDLSNPAAPVLAGQTQLPGTAWLIQPSGNQLFVLGQDSTSNSSQVSLNYLDVTNPASPTLIGDSEFGGGWAWTPAASTFKAFVRGETAGASTDNLVVLPFSGWVASTQQYSNGVQLIEYSPTSITTAGDVQTVGWVERGIFANGRILALSDLALAVVDYSDPLNPTVTGQLTLARNVIAAQPAGTTVGEVSSDWWGNDISHSDVRALPASDPSELVDESNAPDVSVPGVDARVFTNGNLMYVVTAVQLSIPCPTYKGAVGPATGCTGWQEQVQVVDLSNGGATPRGTVTLPVDPGWYWGWGWDGFYAYDWYYGSEIVQVGGDALAFRRWDPEYAYGDTLDAAENLFVVDLSNPDAPAVASTVITQDTTAWWGNMQVVGNTLYTTHYEWVDVSTPANPYGTTRYYIDAIDLTDRSQPKIGASINVPGVLVGGSANDPSVIYTIDYQWDGNGNSVDWFDVLQLSGNLAYLQSATPLDGWVGNVIVSGNTVYTSTQIYSPTGNNPPIELHQIDVTNPKNPVDQVASGPQGWGWILGVAGDRMLVTTGWGDNNGMDVYKLAPNTPPTYDQFVRTQGWSISSIARQGNTLYLSAGEWGVQVVNLD
jgi:hypothetical protein